MASHLCPTPECAASHVAAERRIEERGGNIRADLSQWERDLLAGKAKRVDEAGYVLCWTDGDEPLSQCDRRKNHLGRHSWEKDPAPPHGCLEDRVAALEAALKRLEDRVSSHDGHVYGGGR